MKSIIQYFIDNSLIVNLLTVVIFAVGTYSLFDLQKETFPKVEFDVIVASANYPGSSAEDVEKLVTINLERSLSGVDGIKTLNGISSEGRSILYMEIEPDADLDDVEDEIRNAVDGITDLPDEVDRPLVKSLENKSKKVIRIPLVGNGKNYKEIRRVSKLLRDEIEDIKEVTQVTLDGYREDEIRILLDPIKMNEFELTVTEVKNAVRSENFNLSAGKIETINGDILVRTLSEFKNAEQIKSVIVRSNSEGRSIRIGDVAKVTTNPVEGSVLQRSNGKEAIFLEVNIKEKADIIDSTRLIKNKTKEFFKKNSYPNIKYSYVDELSFYVERRLNVLKENGLFGICLVFLCLLFFLNFSTSVITSLGAPIAFMVSFVLMQMMGISVNLISMFALILVLGMLVDDSIIVAEHFYQKVEAGIPPKKAAFLAATETIKPVFTTVITTMMAFGALFFMGGIMGKFLWPIPVVVIICLVASLFECFIILPSHLADFGKVSKTRTNKWYEFLLSIYKKHLGFFTKYPLIVIIAFIGVFVGSLMLAKTMKFELFPGDDIRVVLIQLKGKVGTPLSKTDHAMKIIENIALTSMDSKTEYDQIRTKIGQQLKQHGTRTGTHYGSLILYLTAPDMRKRSTDEILKSIINEARKKIPDYNINISKMSGGPPKGKDVDIEVLSDDYDRLKLVTTKIDDELKKVKGVTSTELDYEIGKKQLIIKVKSIEAKRLGLTPIMIASELRKILSKDAISKIRNSDEDIDIKLLLNDEFRAKVKSLDLLYILNNRGQRIKLNKVVDIKESPGAFVIRRLNGKRIISVLGALNKDIITPLKITKIMKPKIDKILKDYPEMKYQFGGENKNTKESMQGLLKSFVLALIGIFFVLVIMFSSLVQPFIIMSAIPLGMIGVIWAFKIKGIALGFMAMLGVVGLVGVVVNDSIVLVTFINTKMKELDNIREAVIEASVSRFRAVILTTVTTVAGLLPIAERVGGDPFIRPMAISFAYGLLVATSVTLVFIPCTYIVYARTLKYLKTLSFGRSRHQ